MRSRLISRAPAASVMPIIRPSTCSGTPEIMCFGASPSRFGQFCRASAVVGHAEDHVLRRLAQPLRPVLPDQIVIAADPAGRHDDSLRPQTEIADDLARTALAALGVVGLEDRASDPVDGAMGDGERIDAVAEAEGQEPACLRFARAAFERLNDPRPGAPAATKTGAPNAP